MEARLLAQAPEGLEADLHQFLSKADTQAVPQKRANMQLHARRQVFAVLFERNHAIWRHHASRKTPSRSLTVLANDSSSNQMQLLRHSTKATAMRSVSASFQSTYVNQPRRPHRNEGN